MSPQSAGYDDSVHFVQVWNLELQYITLQGLHTHLHLKGGPTQYTMSYKVSLKVYKMTYLPGKTIYV